MATYTTDVHKHIWRQAVSACVHITCVLILAGYELYNT